MAIIDAPFDGCLAGEVDLGRDRALVERYQSGDSSAFEELYRRYFDRLVRYCHRRLKDRHEAEEVAQEAFVRALRNLDTFGGDRRFYPWLTVIASRIIIDMSRARGRCEPVESVESVESAGAGATDGGTERVVEMVDYTLLDAALSRLTERHRDVLDLRERQGWSYQEIARHYAVNQGTVEQLIFRARKALRREFLALGGDGRLAALPVLAFLSRRLRSWVGRLDPFAAEAVARLGSSAAGVALVAATATGVAGFVNASGAAAPVTPIKPAVAESVLPTAPPVIEPTEGAGDISGVGDAPPPPSAPDAQPPSAAERPVTVTNAADAREEAGPAGADAPGAAAGGDPKDARTDLAHDLDDYRNFVEERLP